MTLLEPDFFKFSSDTELTVLILLGDRFLLLLVDNFDLTGALVTVSQLLILGFIEFISYVSNIYILKNIILNYNKILWSM
jgi:hypothetical protein